mmetsp:Transcript_53976/g.128582  ORF Transcript_53976/g.128582 Transcript_53976/m.128582 type:complete len:206 (+) Transcript_53976:80-697(+)
MMPLRWLIAVAFGLHTVSKQMVSAFSCNVGRVSWLLGENCGADGTAHLASDGLNFSSEICAPDVSTCYTVSFAEELSSGCELAYSQGSCGSISGNDCEQAEVMQSVDCESCSDGWNCNPMRASLDRVGIRARSLQSQSSSSRRRDVRRRRTGSSGSSGSTNQNNDGGCAQYANGTCVQISTGGPRSSMAVAAMLAAACTVSAMVA